MRYPLQFDFDFHTGGKFEPRERFDGFLARPDDIDKPFVGALLELLTGIFVFVNSTKYGHDFFLRRERNGTGNDGIRSFGGFHNLFRRFVDQVVVIAFDSDSEISPDCHNTPPKNWRAAKSINWPGCFIVPDEKTGNFREELTLAHFPRRPQTAGKSGLDAGESFARFIIGHTPRKFPTSPGGHLPHHRLPDSAERAYFTLLSGQPENNITGKRQMQPFFDIFLVHIRTGPKRA